MHVWKHYLEDCEASHIRSMLGRLLPFHSKQKPKKYRVQLTGVLKIYSLLNLCKLDVYNLLLKYNFFHYFLAYQKNIFRFEVLAKMYREWPPHGSMRILNLLANSWICCITCVALSWVSLKVVKYHKFQLNLWWHENCILKAIDPKNICLWMPLERVRSHIFKLNHNFLDVIAQSMQSSICKASSCSTRLRIWGWTSIHIWQLILFNKTPKFQLNHNLHHNKIKWNISKFN
jgi:hypothetical protein